MGLDQYLRAERTYEGDEAETILGFLGTTRAALAAYQKDNHGSGIYIGGWLHSDEDELYKHRSLLEATGMSNTDESPSIFVSVDDDQNVEVASTVAYWRKANAIHAWFVDNCQGGVDECQDTEVHAEQLAMLRSVCEKALAAYEAGDLDGAGEILSPRSGFFFGGTEVDEWWAQDTKETITKIERVITDAIAIGGVKFIYQSSW